MKRAKSGLQLKDHVTGLLETASGLNKPSSSFTTGNERPRTAQGIQYISQD